MSDGQDSIVQLIKEVDIDLRAECGSSVDIISRLLLCGSRKTLQASDHRIKPDESDVALIFDTLVALADEQINNVDFNVVSSKWLSLYVDTSLLSAIFDISTATGRGGIDEACRDCSVRKLDMAMIIGGAIKPKRMEWIQRAIKLAQVNTGAAARPQRPITNTDIPRKRRRLDHVPELLFAPKPIPSLAEAPSIDRYRTVDYESPFVIRGYLSEGGQSVWPAIQRWKNPEYLLSRVGRGRCVPVEEGSSYDDSDWGQRIVPFDEFLARAGFPGLCTGSTKSSTDRPMYLAQHSLFRQFPELEQDINLPGYVSSAPPATASFPSYHPPATGDGVITNVWVGSGSGEIVSPAHTDPYYNCYAQVLGRKRVWVAPPSCGAYMSCHGEMSPQTGEMSPQTDEGTIASQYMTNTSTIPILRPNITSDDLGARYPLFEQHVWLHCMETILEPGDLFVMPPGWWHAMRGEGSGPGWSVSMWY